MNEAIQVITGAAIGIFLLAIANIFGYSQGYKEGYQAGLKFGYFAAKDGAELLAQDDDSWKAVK